MQSSPQGGFLTALLQAYQGEEDAQALEHFFELIVPELKRKARQLLAGERVGHTLQATELVNEAYCRLFDGKPIPWANSREFLSSASGEMRRVLVDHARRADAGKRRRRNVVELRTAFPSPLPSDPLSAIALDEALRSLSHQSERAVKIVELTVLVGLNSHEIGAILETSYRTVEREWRWARKWLKRSLSSIDDDGT